MDNIETVDKDQSNDRIASKISLKGDEAAKIWFLFAVIWFPLLASFGFLLAVKFFLPEFLSGSA
jgi:cytochrome c oxidase cbb3-type subunit I/II